MKDAINHTIQDTKQNQIIPNQEELVRDRTRYDSVGGGKRSKVPGSKGLDVPKTQGPKDKDISKSYSNMILTLKKILSLDPPIHSDTL